MLFRFFAFGFPTCHVSCARNYQMVMWDIGEFHEMRIKLCLN